MIQKRTVFVLGAGASADFQFPLGRGLLMKVVTGITREEANVYHVLGACGFAGDHMKHFADKLAKSMQPSVDAFLENRPEFLEVGKAAIAAALIPYEAESNLARPQQGPHWYEYLFTRLGPTRAEFEQSQLSVITFNYDRSFEHFLFIAARASFGLSDDACKAFVQHVPMVRVYGQLGVLDYVSPNGRRYYPDLNPKMILKCAKEIKILHEGQSDSPQFAQARDLLEKAERVCFLGFGYHKSNMERLQLDVVTEGVPMYCCVYGMEDGEIAAIIPFFGKHRSRMQFGNQNALMFLRSQNVFL